MKIPRMSALAVSAVLASVALTGCAPEGPVAPNKEQAVEAESVVVANEESAAKFVNDYYSHASISGDFLSKFKPPVELSKEQAQSYLQGKTPDGVSEQQIQEFDAYLRKHIPTIDSVYVKDNVSEMDKVLIGVPIFALGVVTGEFDNGQANVTKESVSIDNTKNPIKAKVKRVVNGNESYLDLVFIEDSWKFDASGVLGEYFVDGVPQEAVDVTAEFLSGGWKNINKDVNF